MAKTSAVEKNKRREKLAAAHTAKRNRLKALIMNRETPDDERFQAVLKLAEMPRNGAKNRVRLRCQVSGRSRGNYRKLKLSRIALRDLASTGQIPGMVKSSW